MAGLFDLAVSGMRGLLGPAPNPGLLSGLSNEDIARAMEWQQSVMRNYSNQVPYTPQQVEADRLARWASAGGNSPADVRKGGLLSMGLTPQRYDQAMMWGGLAPMAATVFHGSPHRFNKFDASKIGTGEGAQAYGHGLYFAENPKVAGDYASKNVRFGQALKDGGSFRGNIYKVDLPDEAVAKMLDWDKPLTQQPHIMSALRETFSDAEIALYQLGLDPYKTTGKDLYYRLSGMRDRLGGIEMGGREAQASSRLKDMGIPGIKYLDAGSRSAGEGTSNYVVFDDQIPKIIGRE